MESIEGLADAPRALEPSHFRQAAGNQGPPIFALSIAANLREIRRDYDRARKLPAELVAEISETTSRALEAWKQSRADADYAAFRPWLTRQLDLNRRKAACYGVPEDGETYDALLEDYEPGCTAAHVEAIFAPLRLTVSTISSTDWSRIR